MREGANEMRRDKIKDSGGGGGRGEGMNGTNAKEDLQRLRWKTKGADSAKGEMICMRVIITC